MLFKDTKDSTQPIISLLTDFGLVDPFVAEMKGVILSICPHARLIDVSHAVEKFDVRLGAFLLAEASPYFPPGTIHVAVVDPDVGSSRRAIVIETKRGAYVGPDNGLLIPAAEHAGIMRTFEITNRSFMREQVSSTFHGRDIFASTAAHLANGRQIADCGPLIQDPVGSPFQQATIQGKHAECEVMHIDSFGNVITNLTRVHFSRLNLHEGSKASVHVGRKTLFGTVVKTYADLQRGRLGVLIGSQEFVEIACRESSAARKLGIKMRSVIRISGA
jgi:hypothetical protein